MTLSDLLGEIVRAASNPPASYAKSTSDDETEPSVDTNPAFCLRLPDGKRLASPRLR